MIVMHKEKPYCQELLRPCRIVYRIMNLKTFQIRPLNKDDHEWVTQFLKEYWGSTEMVTRGRIHKANELPGFTALQDDKAIGLVTYVIEGEECEITSLNSLVEEMGIGSALISAVVEVAKSARCNRLWLITTNNNLKALHFYQKRGLSLVAVYPNAIEQTRRLKPEIPLVGGDGIPIRDEIELELLFSEDQ